jgi:hypothetical protein
MTRHFFDKQLVLFGKDFEREATPAVQNKLYQFLANPLIRNILGQTTSSRVRSGNSKRICSVHSSCP